MRVFTVINGTHMVSHTLCRIRLGKSMSGRVDMVCDHADIKSYVVLLPPDEALHACIISIIAYKCHNYLL